MSYKVKGVGFMDGKTRLKHQTLVQEFMELQEETDVMRNKLEAAKQRKLTLAAEVRFLRRRYKFLLETKEQERKLVILPSSLKQTKSKKEKPMISNEYSHHRLPPKPEPKLKKRRGEEVATPSSSNPRLKKKLYSGKDTDRLSLTPISVLNYNGRVNGSQGKIGWKTPIFDLNQSGKCVNDTTTAFRKPYVSLDLNQDSSCSRKEASSQTRAPIFDLNEISTGDEDFQYNAGSTKLVEAKKSLMRGLNDEQQNDLNLSICRNSGDSSPSCIGKRKISWQDPVALRV